MISIDNRKEIFTEFFINLHSIRNISAELKINRDTVNKTIKACRQKIVELNLQNKPDLSEFIDSIVIQPIRKPRIVGRYKVTEDYIEITKQIVIENEKTRTCDMNIKHKNVYELYQYFLNKINTKKEDAFSFVTFSNLVRKIKIELKNIKNL